MPAALEMDNQLQPARISACEDVNGHLNLQVARPDVFWLVYNRISGSGISPRYRAAWWPAVSYCIGSGVAPSFVSNSPMSVTDISWASAFRSGSSAAASTVGNKPW
jgi:hypothetical protein